MKLYKLVSVIVLALLGLMPTQGSAATLGDIDGNGEVNVSDVTALVNQILGTAVRQRHLRCEYRRQY